MIAASETRRTCHIISYVLKSNDHMKLSIRPTGPLIFKLICLDRMLKFQNEFLERRTIRFPVGLEQKKT